jgi:hypothetical protein
MTRQAGTTAKFSQTATAQPNPNTRILRPVIAFVNPSRGNSKIWAVIRHPLGLLAFNRLGATRFGRGQQDSAMRDGQECKGMTHEGTVIAVTPT